MSLIHHHTLTDFLICQTSNILGIEVFFRRTAIRKAPRKPKVTYLGDTVRVKEDVGRLKVPVHDVGFMDEAQRTQSAVNYLQHVML
jgi:hypothetical protein